MRIWDLEPRLLCRQHLLGEHRELHGLWNILTQDKRGYRRHPETRRWEGRLAALYRRHDALVEEMQRRGYRHGSPLDERLATGAGQQHEYIDSPDAQLAILAGKGCGCMSAERLVSPGAVRHNRRPVPGYDRQQHAGPPAGRVSAALHSAVQGIRADS